METRDGLLVAALLFEDQPQIKMCFRKTRLRGGYRLKSFRCLIQMARTHSLRRFAETFR